MSDAAAASFLELLTVHARLFQLFDQHQEALVERDFPRALQRLLTLRREFEAHVTGEEALLTQLFANKDSVRGTPLDLFFGEHKPLRELLVGFEDATRRLDPAAARSSRDVIELLDEEALFKAIFRHHDERERSLLYPALDQSVPGSQRRAELARLHAPPATG